MTSSASPSNPAAGVDPRLAELAEDLANRLRVGEALNLEVYLGEHPEQAEGLRRLLPTIAMMADLGRSAARELAGVPPGLGDPGAALGTLGDYRIIREVGRGGMGVVYEAHQVSLGRRVALKVLPFAATIDPRQLQRFGNEARAAAGLHHTHIVPVFAVGCERGVHYYAMQFIEGRSLAESIGRLRELNVAGPPRMMTADAAAHELASAPLGESVEPTSIASGPFFQTVARLGIQAAEALEYAHSLGVIHRDIKPANLLIDPRGDLWVTDFGLARIHADAGLTMTGDVLGTLRYMSPEQALARRAFIDHRSDIYSLGATIYELLTLRPAVEGRDRQEILRRIAFEEPRPLRRLNASVPRELETVVLKAMAKEPEDRYATAQELAEDLGRFLEHRPIRARRPTVWDRAAKWSRRHTAAVVSAVVLLLLTAVGLAIGTLLVARQRDDARWQRRLAQERYSRVLREVTRIDVALALEWNAQSNASFEPWEQSFLESSLALLDEFIRTGLSDQVTRSDLAEANLHVGHIYEYINQHAKAMPYYRRALPLWEALASEFPDRPDYQEQLGICLIDLGNTLQWVRRGSGESHFRRALLICRSLFGRSPDQLMYRVELANALLALGHCLELSGQAGAALDHYRQALALYEELKPLAPNAPQPSQPELLWFFGCKTACETLGSVGRWDEVDQALGHALERYEKQAPNSRRATGFRILRARFLLIRPEPRRDDLPRAVALAEKSVAAEPQFGMAWNTLAMARCRLGDGAGAVVAMEESLKRTNGGIALDWLILAMAHWQEGDRAQARFWYDRAVADMKRRHSKDRELARIRAEAEAMMGLGKAVPPPPKETSCPEESEGS